MLQQPGRHQCPPKASARAPTVAANAHGVGNIDVFAMNVCLADPVAGLTGGRFVEGILKRADVHLWP
jgi:hypothetical protein